MASHFSSDLRILAAPASPRCSLAQAHPTLRGGVALTYQSAYSLPGGSAGSSKDPPLSGWQHKCGTGVKVCTATGFPPSSHNDSGPSQLALLHVPWSSPALRTPPPSPCRSRCSCRRDRRSPPSSPPARLPAFAAPHPPLPCVTSGLGVTAHSPLAPPPPRRSLVRMPRMILAIS